LNEFDEVENRSGEIDFIGGSVELVKFILGCISKRGKLADRNWMRVARLRWWFEGQRTSACATHSAEILIYDELFSVDINAAVWDDDNV